MLMPRVGLWANFSVAALELVVAFLEAVIKAGEDA